MLGSQLIFKCYGCFLLFVLFSTNTTAIQRNQTTGLIRSWIVREIQYCRTGFVEEWPAAERFRDATD